jgi:FixJ family two-component response regulator
MIVNFHKIPHKLKIWTCMGPILQMRSWRLNGPDFLYGMHMRRTISVIEDDDLFRRAVVGVIQSFGFHAVGYMDASQFLSSLEQTPTDLILSDAQMPGMSGFELLKQIKYMGIQAPIVLMSGSTDLILRRTAIDLGAADYIAKPFEIHELESAIHSALRVSA